MKRYVAIGAAAVILLAGGYSLFWWHGRGKVEQALDAGIGRLEQQGWTVRWDEREIGGYPFGYTVRLAGLTASEADGGLALRLPEAVAETDGTNRILIRIPATFALDLPVPAVGAAPGGAEVGGAEVGGAAAGEAPAESDAPATDPAPMTVLATTGQAENMVLMLSEDGAAGLSADRLSWTIEDPEAGQALTQTVEALEAEIVPDAPGARYRMRAARVGAEAALDEPGGEISTVTADLRDVLIEGSSSLASSGAMAEMIYAGAPGQAAGSLQAGPAQVRVVSAGGTPGTLDWRADRMSGTVTLSSGRLELEGETRGNAWQLTSPDPALPVQGQLSVEVAQAAYEMPMAPAEKPDDMAIRLALQNATADEGAWRQFDPQGVLPRDPASLLLDLTGTARVTERIDRLRPGAPPPFEISTLTFRELSARALGASVTASGEVEILQPIGLPLGELQVGLTGIDALVRALGRAGLLAPETVEIAQAIIAVYLRPAEGEDAWTAEVSFTREGRLVNGLPVQ